MDFDGKTRLRRAVTALRAARRFVGERPRALEVIARHVIRDGLERARVVRARHAVGPIRAAIEQRPEMHACDRSVALHTCPDPHQRGRSEERRVGKGWESRGWWSE